jgi:hypothetical protein
MMGACTKGAIGHVSFLVRELVQTWDDGPALLTRVEDLMVPGTNRQPGSAGKRAHSPAPLAVHVLDLLVLVESESLAWEHTFRRVLDLDPLNRGRSKAAGRAALNALPQYALLLGLEVVVQAMERDLMWWHARCLSLMGISPLEQRYKITEEAARVVGKTPDAFRMWAHRHKVEPVGYIPIMFPGGVTRPAVWDMREVAATVRRRVTVPANG